MLADELTDEDRAHFVASAAASSPGTTEHNEAAYETVLKQARTADSWVGRSIQEWEAMADTEPDVPDPSVAERVEAKRGASHTPGW